MSIQVGLQAESSAKDYLIARQLKWLESNYRCRLGEIDLIMKEGDMIIFVEVRKRCSTRFGGALASITVSKQQKIIKTASHYLLAKRLLDRCPVRFDVVVFEGESSAIQWIKNAFY